MEDVVRASCQRARYFNALSSIRVANDYISGKLSLLFEVKPLFQSDEKWGELGISITPTWPIFAVLVTHNNSINMPTPENRDKQVMFVKNIEVMHDEKGKVNSLARLYLVNHQFKKIGGCGLYADLGKVSLKFAEIAPNGKFSAILDAVRGNYLECLKPSIIKSAIEVVYSIPQHQCEIGKGFDVVEAMFEDFISGFTIYLNDSSVSFVQKFNSRSYEVNVLIGPLDLESGVSE